MLNILPLSDIENTVLQGFVKHITCLYPEELISVELFGSKARGDAKGDSDMDILIVVKDRNHIDRKNFYDFVLDAELNHGIDISLKIYNKNDFDRLVKLNIPFVSNIQKEGVTLWTI